MADIVYITFDGLLEPLGRAQIVEPIAALGARGFRYHIVSLEKARDLADSGGVEATRTVLSDAGVGWTFAEYGEGGGAGNVARNVGTLGRIALQTTRAESATLLHARAHLSAGVAWSVGTLLRVPYLFDLRGFWVDEQLEQGRWVTHPTAYRVAKLGERLLITSAAAVTTLTDLARDDVRDGVFGRVEGPVDTITTITDFERFTPEGPTDAVPAEMRARLEGRLVVAFIGSINVSYATDAALTLFAELHRRRPDAHLLCLTRQTDAMNAELTRYGIGPDACTVTTTGNDEMPQWLRCVDWGLLLLNEPYAKRGSMPTKLAEFFAAGVRPVQYGCNAEVARWVRDAGSGLVLDDLSAESIRKAAERIATETRDDIERVRARTTTRDHFGFEAGLDRYDDVLRALGARPHLRSPHEPREPNPKEQRR